MIEFVNVAEVVEGTRFREMAVRQAIARKFFPAAWLRFEDGEILLDTRIRRLLEMAGAISGDEPAESEMIKYATESEYVDTIRNLNSSGSDEEREDLQDYLEFLGEMIDR
jgi:hypothetical protein